MAAPDWDKITELRQLNGEAKVTYPEGSVDYPQTERLRKVRRSEARKAFLSAEPDATRFPTLVLVEQYELGGDRQMVETYYRYRIMPGPWLRDPLTTVRLGVNAATSIYLERKHRLVAASTAAFQGSYTYGYARSAENVITEREMVEQYVDGDGTAVAAPIHARVTWSKEYQCEIVTRQQVQPFPGTLPTIGDTYSTGGVYAGGAASLTLTGAGSGYSQVALVTIGRASGRRALAHTTMKVATDGVTIVDNGSLWTPGQTITIAGGTRTTPTFLTVARVTVDSITVTAAGSGFITAIGDVMEFSTGGTWVDEPLYVRVTAGALITCLVNAPGTGYAVGDTLTLVNGTGTAATRTVATVKLVSWVNNGDVGSGYAIGEVLTIVGGTGTAATMTVTHLQLVSAAINAAGTLYTGGDVLTIVGGTGTAAILIVDSVDVGGEILTFTHSLPGDYTVSPGASFSVTGGTGSGATFNSALYGVKQGTGSATLTTAGSYSVVPGPGAHATTSSGAGTGAKVSTLAFGVNTTTAATPGSYNTTLPTTFTHTGGTGTGATFNTPTWGLAAGEVDSGGDYTAVAASLSDGSGAAVTPAWGLHTLTITTAGSYTELPPIRLTAAAPASGKTGIGYQPLDLITLAGGTGTAPILLVETLSGTRSGGPIATVSISTAGSLLTLPTSTDAEGLVTRANFTQASIIARDTVGGTITAVAANVVTTDSNHGLSIGDRVAIDSTGTMPTGTSKTRAYWVKTVPNLDELTLCAAADLVTTLPITSAGTGTVTLHTEGTATAGVGAGAEFTGTFQVLVAATGSGTGTGASLALDYGVNSLVLDEAGSGYLTAPTVTITGSTVTNATATAAVTAITIVDRTGYIVDRSSVPDTDGQTVTVYWTVMPRPGYSFDASGIGYLTLESTVSWVRPGTFTLLAEVFHIPPWPGIDTISTPPLSAKFDALIQRKFKFGPLTRAEMADTFTLTCPGAASRMLDIPDRCIHGAIAITKLDGTYAEVFPASTVTGRYGDVYCISAEQEDVAPNIYMVTEVFVPAV